MKATEARSCQALEQLHDIDGAAASLTVTCALSALPWRADDNGSGAERRADTAGPRGRLGVAPDCFSDTVDVRVDLIEISDRVARLDLLLIEQT